MSAALRLHVDGASPGNPGEAGFGVHVTAENGTEVASLYGDLGKATNNVAEYQALLHGLRFALARGASASGLLGLGAARPADRGALPRQERRASSRCTARRRASSPASSDPGSPTSRARGTARPTRWPTARWTSAPRTSAETYRRKPTKLIIRPAAFPSRR